MSFKLEQLCPLLQVFDMPRSIAFYLDVLGFHVRQTNDAGAGDRCDWAMLQRDGSTLMLNTAYEADKRPAAPDPKRIAAHRDVGLYFSCAELDAVYEHLRAHGISADPPRVAPYGMRQLSLRDPDGYGLCLQHPA